jgi:ABC-type amino acid transport substrate-binding protein
MAPARPAALCAALALLLPTVSGAGGAEGRDLDAVKRRGVLRHLGIPYANFVTGSGDGFDVELLRLFAARLGVRYEFVETDWRSVLPDLTGREVSPANPDLSRAPPAPVRGDVAANGMTVLPWRETVVSFSSPVFPTQVWVVARAGSSVQPIAPSGTVQQDIRAVKALLAGRSVLGVANTCLDPALYELEKTSARLEMKDARLDEIAPMLIQGKAELALLDVADAMIALQKFPGEVKVIGPVSVPQLMAVAFPREAPRMREAFEAFLEEARRDGTYRRLIHAYFPEAPVYFPDFFAFLGRS